MDLMYTVKKPAFEPRSQTTPHYHDEKHKQLRRPTPGKKRKPIVLD